MVAEMITPAIQQAMRLSKEPIQMSGLYLSDAGLPEGISEVLSLCASKEKLSDFALKHKLDAEQLSLDLYNFLETVMLQENNIDEKILGGDTLTSLPVLKSHYKLLMKIYHPDQNQSPNAEYFSTLISKAYQRIKQQQEQDVISFSEHRRNSQRHYQAAKKEEIHISYTKTAIAVVSTLTIFTLVAMTGKFFDPANPELISQENVVDSNPTPAQNLLKVTALKSTQNIDDEENKITATSTKLQNLLKDLEVAYEKGDVEQIKPILANTPETQNQTEKQLDDKLETLFEITSERKMVLFDFKWTSVSGTLQGKGRFLSRYQLIGEKNWLTREGTALINANNQNNKLKVTQLVLENQSID